MTTHEPTPLFLVVVVVTIVFVGTSFKSIEPFTVGLLIVILVGLVLMGYGNIHGIFEALGIAPAPGIKNGPLNMPYDPTKPFPVFSSVSK